MIRCLFRATRVPGAPPPYDTLHVRIYYPALAPRHEAERLSGELPVDRSGTPLPVVLFCSGINIPCAGYSWLAVRLARAGLVTVLYDYVAETLPGVIGLTPGLDLARVRPTTYGSGPTCPALRPLFDLLSELNDRADSPLHNALDLTAVALGGHSAGGTVALHNGGYFEAVLAVFAYAGHTVASTPLGFPPDTVLPIADKPTLLMRGDRDGVIAASRGRYGHGATEDPVARTFASALPAKAHGPLYEAVIAGANHLAIVHPQDETTGRAFLDGDLGRPAEAIRQTIADLIAAFLDRHVYRRPVSIGADHTFLRSR